jgi:class 3 adenylate cyclase
MNELTSISLFTGVSPEALGLITPEMIRFYMTGDDIVTEADAGTDLVVLMSGEARVCAGGTYLVTRRAGEVIGEQGLLENVPRSATVTAQGAVKALLIPALVVAELFKDAAFMKNIALGLSRKLREATADRAIRYEQGERLFEEFSAHSSPEVASQLLADRKLYESPRFVDAVILMADIRGFTASCQRMQQDRIAQELGRYLDLAVGIIHSHRGFVDKFIGDAVLAVWGITPSAGDLASQAFACAKAMIDAASKLEFGGEPIQIGVGLSAGRVFAGNVGGKGKRQFTVLGSPVNLASRLEAECKTLHAPVVVAEGFRVLLSEIERADLSLHEGREIKGFAEQTVYAWRGGESRVLASDASDSSVQLVSGLEGKWVGTSK